MNSGFVKSSWILVLSFFLAIIIFIICLEGVFYFDSNNESDFKEKGKMISVSDTLKFSNLNTYLDCNFDIVNIPLNDNQFNIYGRMPIDKNHIFPGIGKINVVAWIDIHELNLHNSILQFELQANDSSLNLHFWFQVKRENKRIANFMTVEPISKYSVFRNGFYVVNLPINQVQFKCMGTSFLKRRVYGCDIPLEEALSNVNVDFGFINLLSDSYNDNCTYVNLIIRNINLIKSH
jgi:hypothetical protein